MGTLRRTSLREDMSTIQAAAGPAGDVSQVTSQLKETLVTSSSSSSTSKGIKLEQDIGTSLYDELWPVCQTGNSAETDAKTREFLKRVVEILLDHIAVQNDRTVKILDFHSPEQLKEVI